MIDVKSLKQFRDTDYYVNSDGEIYRKYKDKYKKLNGTVDANKGYRRIRVNIYRKRYDLPRVVWEAFNGEIPEGYVVEHRNGCSTMNDLVNLRLAKRTNGSRYKGKNQKTRKIIDLCTRKIYRGTREAERFLKHSRNTIIAICNGIDTPKIKLKIAYWDDVNGKAFRGNYDKYYLKHMKDKEL